MMVLDNAVMTKIMMIIVMMLKRIIMMVDVCDDGDSWDDSEAVCSICLAGRSSDIDCL